MADPLIVVALLTGLASLGVAIFGYFSSTKTAKINIDAQAFTRAEGYYRNAMDEQSEKYAELKNENKELKVENAELRMALRKTDARVSILEKAISDLGAAVPPH